MKRSYTVHLLATQDSCVRIIVYYLPAVEELKAVLNVLRYIH